MKKRLFIFCVIGVLIIQCLPVFSAATEFNDDFEAYSDFVGGNWYCQGNGDISVVPTDRGKSAYITSDSSAMSELIYPFAELGESVESFKTSYSIYLEDNKADRSFYIKDTSQGEFPLFTFMADTNTVSINGRISEKAFSYEIGVWYDVAVQFNTADGIVKVDISDGTHSVTLYGVASKINAQRVHRIDFVSFKPSDGEAACYVDDVYFTPCEPYKPKLSVSDTGIFETFDNSEFDGHRIGCFKTNSTIESGNVCKTEISDGYAAKLTPQDTTVLMSASMDFLDSDAFCLDFMINKLSASTYAEIYLTSGTSKHPLMTFENGYLLLPDGESTDITVGSFEQINLHCETANGKLGLTVNNHTIQSNISPVSSADEIVFSVRGGGNDGGVILDNILCFPAQCIRMTTETKTPEFEKYEKCLLNEDFNSCNTSLPDGFFTQVTPHDDTSSSYLITSAIDDGTLCLKSGNAIFEVIKPIDTVSPGLLQIDFSIKLPDSNARKSLYIRNNTYGEMNILTFNPDKTVTIGYNNIAADIFSYRLNVCYDASVIYNLADGNIEVLISDGDSSHTLHGSFKANVTDVFRVYFVNFACSSGTAITYIDNLSVTAFEMDYPTVYTPYVSDDKWLISSHPSNGDTAFDSDTKKITLQFTSVPTGGIYLLNGTDELIESVSVSGNTVILDLYGLSRNTDYTLSYSDVSLSDGDRAFGRIEFSTDCTISVSDIGFKDTDGTVSAMNKDGTACWFTAYSEEECRIYAYAALYDKTNTRLLNINTKAFDITKDMREYDMHIDVPDDISLYNMKIIVTDSRFVPLKSVTYALPFADPDGSKVMEDFADYMEYEAHPRLMTTRNDINRIRANIVSESSFADTFNSLLVKANSYLMAEPQEYRIPDGIRLLSAAQEIRTRVETLGIVYQLTGDIRYAGRLYDELENAASYPDWNPRHFLDCATMLASFALGYDYAYDYIAGDDVRKQTVIDAVADMGFEPLLDDYLDRPRNRTYKWTVTNEPDNWNVVCNSGAILAALSFAEDLPQYSMVVFDYALPLLRKAAVRFAPDGAWFEGVGYWDYTLNYYVDILTSMQNCLGTDYGFSDVEGLDKTGYFLHAMTGSGGVFNFSDSSSSKIGGGEIFGLAAAIGDKELEALHYNYMISNNFSLGYRGLISYRGNFDKEKTSLPDDWYFRGTEAVSLSSGDDADDIFVGFCGGENFVPHAHLDIGSFVLDMCGQRFVCDLGSENYNIPGSIWNLYRNRAEGHNTIVINPDSEPDQRTDASAVIDRFYASDSDSFAVCDMTGAYAPDASSAIRGIRLTENKSVVLVQDEIRCPSESDVWWFAHTTASVRLSADCKTAILTRNGKSVKAEIISPDGRFSVMDAQPMSSSPQNSEQNENIGYKKLAVKLTNVTDVTFAVVFMPADYNHNQSDIISIKNWK